MLISSLVLALAGLATASTSDARGIPRSQKRSRARANEAITFDARSIQARAPPAGWSLFVAPNNDGGGCYQDFGSPRVLTGWSGYFGTSSIEKAITECKGRGFDWVGVEYGGEVYCGSQPSNLRSAPSSECNSRCSSGEICGGAWRMNLYTLTPTPPAGSWAHQGCFKDDGNRALKGFSFYDGRMTISKCQTECRSRGFVLAGVEHGTECYCSNTHSAPRLGDGSCNVKCPSGETNCGGAWAFSLYSFSTSIVSTPTPISSASPSPTPANTIPSGWRYLHCITDSSNRALQGSIISTNDMTPAKCVNDCASRGFALAGLQDRIQCFCGNALMGLSSGAGRQVGEGECSSNCAGGIGKCGGAWRMNLYTNLNGVALSSALGQIQTTTTTTATTAATTTTTRPATTTSPTTTTTPSPTSTPTPTPPVPGSFTPPGEFKNNGGEKQIYAHHMIGNTYPYNAGTWRQDINEAKGAGIDGFILNLGSDSWQPDRVRDAYEQAQSLGFKMALSFDMEVLGCGTGNANLIRNYLSTYVNHPAAAKYRGKSVVTTFSGSSCTFGQGSVNSGWASVLNGPGYSRGQIWFVPAFHVDPQSLPSFDIDAECNWGSAWPDKDKPEIETSRDEWFMQQLNRAGKGYMGTVSPVFATHLPYKNWIWRSDNMLMAVRWEQLLGMRDKLDQVQVIAWNDYGESSYLSPIRGDMPREAREFANDNFPHSDLLSLQAFYSSAWKNGRYPAITRDQIWAMARPHPANAFAPGDYGPPNYRQLTNDNLYTQIHLLAPASITLCSGSNCATRQGNAGINRFSHPLVPGQLSTVRVNRDNKVVASVDAPTAFNGSPAKYNFNYWVKSS